MKENIIIIFVLVIIIGLALFYIYRSKKKGQKCIGCPHSKNSCCCCKNQKDKIF